MTEETRPVGEDPAGAFTTRFADRDIPAETIRGWYMERSPERMEDLVGLDEAKRRLLALAEEMCRPGAGFVSCILYGLPGGGKTMLLQAFAGCMLERGFRVLRVRDNELLCGGRGYAENAIDTAFAEAVDASEPGGAVLLFDNIDVICPDRENRFCGDRERRMTEVFLRSLGALRRSGKRVLLLGATYSPEHMDLALASDSVLIPIPLPDREAREAQLRRLLPEILVPPEGTPYRRMAEETENFSFRELEALTGEIKIRLRKMMLEDPANLARKENGEPDQEQTDENVIRALMTGAARVTPELFREEMEQARLPRDKAEMRNGLLAFEKRLAEARSAGGEAGTGA